MKLMMHICCAPCLLAPISVLKKDGISFSGVFVNPNIHPYTEYAKRLRAVEVLAEREGGVNNVSFPDQYGLKKFLNAVMIDSSVAPKAERCRRCWDMRLQETAAFAKANGFDAFSSTLLASPMQDHERIRKIGESIAYKEGIEFYYRDFRPAFEDAQKQAKKMSLYRQQYCGCIFSEQERYESKRQLS